MALLLELRRDPETYPTCTLGVLTVLGYPTRLQTIERPWVPNVHGGKSGAKYESCVAEGTYNLTRHLRPSGERAWALVNHELDVYYLPSDVPRGREAATRTLVLIHAGNFVHDVIGCIAPGMSRSKTRDGWMVERSRDAMNALRTMVGETYDVKLRIYREPYSGAGGSFAGGGATGNWRQ